MNSLRLVVTESPGPTPWTTHGPHFDCHPGRAVTGEDVDLTTGDFDVVSQDLEAVPIEKGSTEAFAGLAELSSRQGHNDSG